MSYGYERREDPPARAIPSQSPESRVASPGRLESRATEAAVKNPPDAGEPFLMVHCMIGNAVVPIGNAWTGGGGGSGSSTSTFGWQTDTNRYGTRVVANGTMFGGAGYHEFKGPPIITPRRWLDPLWVGSRGPAVVRVSDVVRFAKTSAPTTQGWVFCRIGYASTSTASIAELPGFIGFSVYIPDGSSTGTWRCLATDAGTVKLYEADTGIDSAALHKLEVELNAATGYVRWYLDDVMVGEWTPGSAQAAADISTAATPKRWMYSVQAQEKSAGLPGNATLDYGLDGWISVLASFDSPAVG